LSIIGRRLLALTDRVVREWPDWLRKIDALLEHEAVIEVAAQDVEIDQKQSSLTTSRAH